MPIGYGQTGRRSKKNRVLVDRLMGPEKTNRKEQAVAGQ